MIILLTPSARNNSRYCFIIGASRIHDTSREIAQEYCTVACRVGLRFCASICSHRTASNSEALHRELERSMQRFDCSPTILFARPHVTVMQYMQCTLSDWIDYVDLGNIIDYTRFYLFIYRQNANFLSLPLYLLRSAAITTNPTLTSGCHWPICRIDSLSGSKAIEYSANTTKIIMTTGANNRE